MIKYHTKCWIGISTNIKAVEVDRESEKSVWINGRAVRKNSEFGNYHDSWEEAKKFLVGKASDKVEKLTGDLKKAQDKLEEIWGLKNA